MQSVAAPLKFHPLGGSCGDKSTNGPGRRRKSSCKAASCQRLSNFRGTPTLSSSFTAAAGNACSFSPTSTIIQSTMSQPTTGRGKQLSESRASSLSAGQNSHAIVTISSISIAKTTASSSSGSSKRSAAASRKRLRAAGDDASVTAPPALRETKRADASLPPFLLLSVLVACMGSFAFGYHISIINGPLDRILIDIGAEGSTVMAGFIVSIPLLVAIFGALSGGLLADRVGRRFALQVSAVPFVIGSSLSAISSSLPPMLIGRALVGAAIGLVSGVVPLYISEISPSSVRGALGSVVQLAICVGIFSSLLMGLPLSSNPSWWRVMFWFGAALPLAMAVAAKWLPESPEWLIRNGKAEEASKILLRLGVTSSSDTGEKPSNPPATSFEKNTAASAASPAAAAAAAAAGDQDYGLKQEERNDTTRKASSASSSASGWGQMLQPRYRRVLLIGSALFLLQQFAGINAVIYFSSSVFRQAGVKSEVAASSVVALANVLGSLVSSSLVDGQGRKKLLTVSFLGMGLCMLLLCAGLSLPLLKPFSAPLALVGTVCYVLSFAFGVGPIPALLLPEIFPASIRANGVALSLGVHWVCNFLIGLMFLPLTQAFGVSLVYLGFSLVCFVGIAFVQIFLVETKGKTLEEIEAVMCKDDA